MVLPQQPAREPAVFSVRGGGVLALLVLFCMGGQHGFSQAAAGEQVNFNEYYKFPLSVGVLYQSFTPFSEYPAQSGAPFTIYGLSGSFRVPLPFFPIIQPVLQAGLTQYSSRSLTYPGKWDHQDYSVQIGFLAVQRFAKNFEIGAILLGGYALSVFPSLAPEEGVVSSGNLVFDAGASISLDPSFNFSVDILPGARYVLPIGLLHDFRGILFSIGFAAHFRFGEDPDALRNIIRYLRFMELSIPPVFAAMQSYYVTHPVGTLTITNTENVTVTDLEVSFYQAGYMDGPTIATTIPEMKPKESRIVELRASYNSEVFATEGVTPLSGEVKVTYKARGRAAEQKQAVNYDLYDKTGVIWNDDRKVAAFVTPSDSALINYAGYIGQACKADVLPDYNGPVQTAAAVFRALTAIGCLYKADPSTPYASFQGNVQAVDTVSLPRNTLKNNQVGDCDDLTVLFCSVLEASGIETGFITVPGHIYAAFNTKVPVRSYARVHPDRSLTLPVDGELWVPVEITMIGTSSFSDAWRKGIEEFARYDAEPEKRRFYSTRASWDLYRPIGLKESDLGLQYGNPEALAVGFRSDIASLSQSMIAEHRALAQKSRRKEDYNRLGVECARLRQYAAAESAFLQSLNLDPAYLNARTNLGNLQFLRKDFAGALKSYLAASQALDRSGTDRDPTRVKIMLNISKTYFEMKDQEKAKEYYAKAAVVDPVAAATLSYLSGAGGDQTRASSSAASAGPLFLSEDEGD
jgi:hypothetical protein